MNTQKLWLLQLCVIIYHCCIHHRVHNDVFTCCEPCSCIATVNHMQPISLFQSKLSLIYLLFKTRYRILIWGRWLHRVAKGDRKKNRSEGFRGGSIAWNSHRVLRLLWSSVGDPMMHLFLWAMLIYHEAAVCKWVKDVFILMFGEVLFSGCSSLFHRRFLLTPTACNLRASGTVNQFTAKQSTAT